MKTLTLLLGVFLFWNFGYYLANRTFYKKIGQPFHLIGGHSTPSSAQERPTALSHQAESKEQIKTSDTVEAQAQYQSIVEKFHLEKKNSDLSAVFASSPAGASIAKIAVLLDFLPQIQTPAGALISRELEILRNQSRETLDELQQDLPKLSLKYSHERQFLVQYVLQLNVDTNSKIDFFGDDLQRSLNPYEPQNQASYNGVIALSALMKVTEDPNIIEPRLRQTLSHQPDSMARSLLISTFASKYPDRAKTLKTEF